MFDNWIPLSCMSWNPKYNICHISVMFVLQPIRAVLKPWDKNGLLGGGARKCSFIDGRLHVTHAGVLSGKVGPLAMTQMAATLTGPSDPLKSGIITLFHQNLTYGKNTCT